MKRGILVFAILLSLSVSAFAADFGMSFGGGFIFSGAFYKASTEAEYIMPGLVNETEETVRDLNYGGFLFFDATYGEAYLSFSGGRTDLETTMSNVPLPPTYTPTSVPRSYPKDTMSIGIGLLGKYPFTLNKFTLYPLLGVEYQIFLSGDYGDEYAANAVSTKASDFNTLWFRIGGGVNYDITDSFYVMGQGLYGFKMMPTSYDKNNTDFVEGDKNGSIKTGWVNTVTIKLGVGYRI